MSTLRFTNQAVGEEPVVPFLHGQAKQVKQEGRAAR